MYKKILILFVILTTGCNIFSITSAKEGDIKQQCFDYIDNDNNNALDINDVSCMSYAVEDWDNDGFINVDEYEQGTSMEDTNSHP